MNDEPPPPAAPSGPACPVPIEDHATVQLAHGGGGRLTRNLVERLFVPAFENDWLAKLDDGAVLPLPETGRLAFTTDSFVIRPLFFPGGNIGSLAVHGTVNDLAMCGAEPRALSAGFILEEGLPMEDLRRIVGGMAEAAAEVGIPIVTGDTKVVDRGAADGVFINTTGVGIVALDVDLGPARVRAGDAVLLNGRIADHGIAVLCVREGLELETTLTSDAAALHGLVADVLAAGGRGVHVLRDPTRGGIASALNEIADAAGVGIVLEEGAIPLDEAVRGACEVFGLDPLYVANEGKCLAIVAQDTADDVLAAMRSHPLGREAAIVGRVSRDPPAGLHLNSTIGSMRVVGMLSGEQLPRIC